MRVTFLGTGTSTGVPQIGCQCEVCRSYDEHDKRLRCSALIETDDTRVLIDCGPDFRQQIMRYPFEPIDAVLLTHEHYDHVGGLDDLRPFCKWGDVQLYAEANVCQAIRTRMPYCFGEKKYLGVPDLVLNEITLESFTIKNITIQPIRVLHGKLPIVGFRIGNMAYITDALAIPESEYSKLQNLDVLVINALRDEPHPAHQNIGQALQQVERIQPRETYFTHMSHHFGLHAKVERALPPHVHVAYDGLEIVDNLEFRIMN